MRIIITRHGETIENLNKIIQGHLPGNLSKTGLNQAKQLGLRLKNEKIDYIYCSDLKRTVDTSLEISKFHPNSILIFDESLREKYHGSWEGKTRAEIKYSTQHNDVEAPDGETFEQLFERAKSFLDKLKSNHRNSNDTILLIGHNGINRAIIGAIHNFSLNEIKNISKIKNTSVSIYELDSKSDLFEEILFNCTKHLDLA